MHALFRFRDLSCPENETINRHKSIIQQKGYVYWGWWNKGHEKLPLESLVGLGLTHQEQNIYLFDSAQRKFYQARCEKIVQQVPERILSPDAEATPDYYVETKCLMWLKLLSIDEIEENTIIGVKSYSEISDLFLKDNHYDIFNNKVVFDGAELSEQNRTIWLVRDRVANDKHHKIMLSTMSSVEPRHFDSSVNFSHRDSILWISDPHFTDNGKHGFNVTSDTAQNHTLATTLRHAYNLTDNRDIATLVVSGDITWSARKEEFDIAEDFLSTVCTIASLDKSWIGFCPGNHDLAFHSDEMESIDLDSIPENCRLAKENYSVLYRKFFNIEPDDFLCSGRRFILGSTKPVEIVFLNSVMLQQKKESFQGFGFIGQDQLAHVEKMMKFNGSKPRNLTRICVMHHHLIPVSLTENGYDDARYSTVLDSERLSRWLTKHKFDFLLHGHMHQNFHCKIERSVITHKESSSENINNVLNVLSLGSSGVVSGHTGEAKGNWVCKIQFTDDDIVFKYKQISSESSSLAGDYELRFPYSD